MREYRLLSGWGLALMLLAGCSPANSQSSHGIVEASSSEEMAERMKIYAEVDALVRARDFAKLNALVDHYRIARSRTPSGVWKLPFFYNAMYGPYVFDRAENQCKNGLAAFADDWIRFDPREPAPHIVKADAILAYGSCVRGEKFAYETPDEDMKVYQVHALKAFRYLDSKKDIAIKDPQYFASMIDIAKSASLDRSFVLSLLNELVAREPYYYAGYFAAVEYFRPRWHGSAGDVDWVGRFAVKATPDDGESAYARVFWSFDALDSDDLHQMDWETTKRGMRQLYKAYPVEWNAAHFVRMSCRMRDLGTAGEFASSVRPDSIPESKDDPKWLKCLEIAHLESNARRQ